MFSKFIYRSLSKKYKNYISAGVLYRASRYWGNTKIRNSLIMPAIIVFTILYSILVPISILHHTQTPVALTTEFLLLTIFGYAIYFKFIQRYRSVHNIVKEYVEKIMRVNTYEELINLSNNVDRRGVELVFYSQYSINMFFEAFAKYHHVSLKSIVTKYTYGLRDIPIETLYNEMAYTYNHRLILTNGFLYFTNDDGFYIADMRKYGDYTVELL